MLRLGRWISDQIADVLFPERCAACATIVAARTLFCHACRATVNVLGPPECDRCGRPLRDSTASDCCGDSDHAPIRRVRAFARYDAGDPSHPVADALHAFKYRGLQRLAPRLASAMLPRIPAATATTIIAPVPLHRVRLRTRGFNQSALLATHVGQALGCPVAVRLLVRTRDTPSQTALSAAARRANVADAFAVRRAGDAHGRDVILIDDVWTSGATTEAAARALRADGARAVDVVTFARVPETR
jgi:ComF family protein